MIFISLCFAAVLAVASGVPPPKVRIDSHKAAARQERQADSNCPLACPPGWVKWIGSSQCYLMPPHPAHLDTFWNWDARCKAKEPTSYVAVSNNFAEQAVGMAIAPQYAPQWFTNAFTSFIWLGGYTTPGKWHFLDGTDQTSSLFFLGAFGSSLAGIPNGTCMSTSPATLGLWDTKDCTNPAGTAICEMAPRPVCGETGGYYLPIAPINLDFASLVNFFPRLPEIPYVKQIFKAFGLDNALSYVGDTIKCWFAGYCGSASDQVTPLPDGCRWACPQGWYSFSAGPLGQCYLLPDFDTLTRQGSMVPHENFWTAQIKCNKTEASSNLMVINSLPEMAQIEHLLKRIRWSDTNPGAYLWLGQHYTNGMWNYLDGSYQKGNLIMTLNQLWDKGDATTRSCLAADLTNGGNWRPVPCDQKSGLYLCEMPKKQICSNTIKSGGVFEIRTAVDMSLAHWREMFPKMPQEVPFLDDYLEGRFQQSINISNFNPSSSSISAGDSVAQVICVKLSVGWLLTTATYDYLWTNGERTTVNGRWVWRPCRSGGGPGWSFKSSTTSVLSAYSRCYNRGYSVAMPVWTPFSTNIANSLASKLSGWYPFQVGERLAPYIVGGLISADNSNNKVVEISKC